MVCRSSDNVLIKVSVRWSIALMAAIYHHEGNSSSSTRWHKRQASAHLLQMMDPATQQDLIVVYDDKPAEEPSVSNSGQLSI